MTPDTASVPSPFAGDSLFGSPENWPGRALRPCDASWPEEQRLYLGLPVRILHEKGFLEQTNDERPYRYRPARSYEEVSRRLLGEVLERVFRGSREQLLVRLIEQRQLTARERAILEEILEEGA